MQRPFFLSSLLAGSLLVLSAAPAHAQYRDLCDSSKVCEYTGPNAPVLDADVCLDPTGTVRLKGSAGCSHAEIPFHARFGEVYEPLQQLVVAYIPLQSACTVPGLCEAKEEYSPNTGTAQALCCINGVCWPGIDGCQGTLMWCDDGVCNEDGTVTCFEGTALP
ncbi:hypothetical protein PPSIR1_38099 [Plesiocystis pacifica SIR-1]|uniref:Uncharacterized protein n=1 Tax=Plesiocystis pacifica SIR-1 TaxID=391625 RepID=A6GBP9_9BACT|nr:hypothetical protein [Plesiocystis pacifica]EDM76666.1 hypothetical protein PPSIR1_38099 [Plesiocystis pacifica SIR-1]